MSTTNRTLVFASIPSGVPVPGEHIKVENRPIDLNASLQKDAVLVKNSYISFDPYQRGRMRDASIKSYSPAYELNTPVINSGISTVLKSANANFKEGDQVEVYMSCPTSEYALLTPEHVASGSVRKIDNPHNLDLKHYTHALGMPGLTAYSSLYEIAGPLKKGETIFISSAAGAVGQLVAELAKRAGLHVIGSVGSKEKLDFIVNELGMKGFNYKDEKPSDALKRLAPNGLDVYYDNVGGEHLEAAIDHMNNHGRIVECGQVSQYNLAPSKMYPIRNLMRVVAGRLKMQGFIVMDENMGPKYHKQHRENVGKWISEGSFKPKLDETVGIENSAQGLVGMLEGKNFGKAVLRV